MRPHPRIRKTIKCGGAALTVLLVVVWIGSAWWAVGWQPTDYTHIEVEYGQLRISHTEGWVARSEASLSVRRSCDFYEAVPRPRLRPWPLWRNDAGRFALFEVYIPLWMLGAVTFVPTALAFRLDTLARRRERMNLCAKCHYDRTGLAAEVVCPECGAAAR